MKIKVARSAIKFFTEIITGIDRMHAAFERHQLLRNELEQGDVRIGFKAFVDVEGEQVVVLQTTPADKKKK